MHLMTEEAGRRFAKILDDIDTAVLAAKMELTELAQQCEARAAELRAREHARKHVGDKLSSTSMHREPVTV